MDEEGGKYDFAPPYNEFEKINYGKNSTILDKDLDEYKLIYKDYYKRITKIKSIKENEDEKKDTQNININEKNIKKNNTLTH